MGTLPPCADQDETRSTCRHIMQLHASTRERMHSMEQLYQPVGRNWGSAATYRRTSCGLHRLRSWMGFRLTRVLHAPTLIGDCDSLNRFLSVRASQPWPNAAISGRPSRVSADLVLLMKALPGAGKQEKGGAARALRRLDAEWVIVSTPFSELIGTCEGMYETTLHGIPV